MNRSATIAPAAAVDEASRTAARWSGRHDRPVAVRYGAAVLLAVAGAVGAVILRPVIAPTLLPPFFVAVALSAWYGGFGPALTTTLLSMLAIDVFVVEPVGRLDLGWDDVPRLLAFVVAAGVISGLSAAQQRTEAALRASERRFRSMVEVANEGVWLVDTAGATAYANDRMGSLLGTTAAALHGRPVWDFVFSEDAERLRRRFAEALRGRLDQFEVRLRRADGAEIYVLVASSPIRDAAGGPAGVLAVFTDLSERRRAELAVARANERFGLAAEAVQALIYDWDVTTGRVERSQGLEGLVGWNPEEAPPTAEWWHARIHPGDLARIERRSLAELLSGDRFSREYRVRHRDGRWVAVWDQGRVVHAPDGRPVRVVGSAIDVSARREAEDALRVLANAGEVLAAGLDFGGTLDRVASLPIPILADWCAIDLAAADGAIRRAAAAGHGGDGADAAPAACPDPALAAAIVRSGRPLLASATPVAIAGVDAWPEPREPLARCGATALLVVPLQARGACFGAMTLLSRTPERRYGEREVGLARELARRVALAIDNARLLHDLQEAEARYRGLFEGTTDGILVVDTAGRFVDANPALLDLLGYAREELLALGPGDVAEPGAAWAAEEFDRLRREGGWRGELELRRKDGSVVPTEARIAAVRLPAQTVYVAVLRDVTERKALERLQEAFVATAAHDLKNPLAAVRGQAQLLRRWLLRGESPDPERLRGGLESIEAGAARMGGIIDELVDAVRLRAGQTLELRRDRVDLVALARQTVEVAQRATESHRLRFEAAAPAVVGEWDGARLERVLENLLANAVKYSPAGGEIAVRVRREEGADGPSAVLAVADRGVGIPAADLPHVFERFRRGGNVGTIAGTGIGLAGACRIVEQHGGTIAVESAEGVGSTFTVRLPLAAAAADGATDGAGGATGNAVP